MQTMDDNSAFRPPSTQANYSYQNPKKPNKLIFIVLFLILLVGVGFGFWKFFLVSEDSAKSVTITPTPTEYQFPTDTPTPEASPTISAKPVSPTIKLTATPTKTSVNPVDSASGLDRSAISVTVQNGSGEVGVAGKARDFLTGLGYNIASTGNADNYDYVNLTIQVKSTASKYLPLLKKDLGFSYTVGTTSADLSSSFASDALVIVGK